MKKFIKFMLFGVCIALLAGCGNGAVTDPSAMSEEDEDGSVTDLSAIPEEDEDGSVQKVKVGDIVNIDFVGTLDGVAFDGGTDYGFDLGIGSGRFIKGFEEQIVGMKVGEVRDINVTFPANYYPDYLAGQPVVFRVTLNYINE